jgi:hypothetical protein
METSGADGPTTQVGTVVDMVGIRNGEEVMGLAGDNRGAMLVYAGAGPLDVPKGNRAKGSLCRG